jgi:hypothetical protein
MCPINSPAVLHCENQWDTKTVAGREGECQRPPTKSFPVPNPLLSQTKTPPENSQGRHRNLVGGQIPLTGDRDLPLCGLAIWISRQHPLDMGTDLLKETAVQLALISTVSRAAPPPRGNRLPY